MKGEIKTMFEQAESLSEQLQRIGGALGHYKGEQLNETNTERQLDRWTQERGLGESMDAAITHMKKVVEELRWIQSELEK